MVVLAALGACPVWVTGANAQGPNITVKTNKGTMCIVRSDGPADQTFTGANGTSDSLYSYTNVVTANMPYIGPPSGDQVVPVYNVVPFTVNYGGSWPSTNGKITQPSSYSWSPDEPGGNWLSQFLDPNDWRSGQLQTALAPKFKENHGAPNPYPVTQPTCDQEGDEGETYEATLPDGSANYISKYTLKLHDPVVFVKPGFTSPSYICAIIDVPSFAPENNTDTIQDMPFNMGIQASTSVQAQVGGELLTLSGSATFTFAAGAVLSAKVPPGWMSMPEVVIRCTHTETEVKDWYVSGKSQADTEVTNTGPYIVTCRMSKPYFPGPKPPGY